MTFQKPREIATRALLEQAQANGFIEHILDRHLRHGRWADVDRALVQELTYGVVRWKATLDWLIQRKATRPPARLVEIVLRLGLYQLFWLDRIPAHAAVHETVAVGKNFGLQAEAGFVNAILRSYSRDFEPTRALLAELRQRDPPIGFSHPGWLVDRWLNRWRRDEVDQLLQWNNSPPAVFARVNTLRATSDELQRRWRDEGVESVLKNYPWSRAVPVFELVSHPALARLASFEEGQYYIQDPSTLLAVSVLDPRAGENILDCCSAPGGKTTLAAQFMQDQGSIVATDRQPERLALVNENCRRLGVTCVHTGLAEEMDNAVSSPRFDRVLVDAPCSNTGVLRRRVDLRWRIQPDEIVRLVENQIDLLERASRHVRRKGVLVYSTCSMEPEENQGVIDRFRAVHPEFHLESTHELLPFREGVDGAYVAKLTRS